jgi:spoIIIJ-associated protein
MSGKRRFFSGTSESQAAIEAAAALGVPVTELAYRLVDKRGALRPGRVVIEVDPDHPRRAEAPVAPGASAAGVAPASLPAPQRQGVPSPSPAQDRREEPGWRQRRDGDASGWSQRSGQGPRAGDEVVLAVASPEASLPLSGEAGAAEAARALAALAALEVEPRVQLFDESVQVDLAGAAAPRLAERQGELLRAFEYLLRRMVRELPEGGLVADSGGFRAEREATLRRRAAAAAEAVRSSGEPVVFEPLPAAERRIVHIVVQAEPGVASASEGDGEAKRLRIFRAP